MSELINLTKEENIEAKFFNAVETQDIIEIKKCIKFVTNIAYKSHMTGKTALHILAKFSSFAGTDVEESNELISWLVKTLDFDVNLKDSGNWTPLHLACRFTTTTSHISTVRLLLELGANVHAVTNQNTPPLILAVNESRRASSDEVVSLLLDYGANIDVVNKQMTPLMYACRDSHIECADDDFNHCRSSITTVELLLKRGADPNFVNDGITPLLITYNFLAKGNTHIDTLKMLIKYGANVHLIVGGQSFYNIINNEIKEQLIPDLTESDVTIDQRDLVEQECMFCLDALPEVKFNCGHLCVCAKCYKYVYECYTCFEKVKTYEKIKIKLH